MKYYFSASTEYYEKDRKKYKMITSYLDHLGNKGINYVHYPVNDPKRLEIEKRIADGEVSAYDLQIANIKSSDYLIVEATRQTITIGYQIQFALNRKIPTLVLLSEQVERRESVTLTHDQYGILFVRKYKDQNDIQKHIDEFLGSITSDRIKFNFYLSLGLHNYLSKRAEVEGRTKSDLVRSILTSEQKKNPLK